MSETAEMKMEGAASAGAGSAPSSKPSLLGEPRADAALGILPRTPAYPASNYTYAKRAERMRVEAESGTTAELDHQIRMVAGSNTYARATRAYGQLLIEFRTKQDELAAAVAEAEALVGEAVKALPAKKAKKVPPKAKQVSFTE